MKSPPTIVDTIKRAATLIYDASWMFDAADDVKPTSTMKFILYIPLFIVFQLIGNWLKVFWDLPIPGATIGMSLLLSLLFIIPSNKNLTASAQKLLLHLPLFFIPAGVGIMNYSDVLKQDSLALFASVFGATILCFILAALFTQRLLKSEDDANKMSESKT